MRSWRQRLAFRWLAREEMVAIGQCVDFGGFRYGRGDYNPYESYLRTVVSTGDVAGARAQFVEFLQYYRPRHFGEVLGLKLQREYPAWLYPWARQAPLATPGGRPGWFPRPEDGPDIRTYFSEPGILWQRIEQEFRWLDGALASIRQHGFQPEKFRSQLQARKFVRIGGDAAWLILDGNHRMAALASLGHAEVPVHFLPMAVVREADLPRWPQVRNGVYTEADASHVFMVHFHGNQRPRTTDRPAQILGGQT